MAFLSVPTGGSVEYFERPDSPEESFANGVGKVRRIFDVDWDDRWQFAQLLLGWAQVSTAQNQGQLATFVNNYISRTPPSPYTEITKTVPKGLAQSTLPYWLYATAIESMRGVSPVGFNTNNTNVYELARLTVTYESLTYDPFSDQQVFQNGWVNDNGNPSDVWVQKGPPRKITPVRFVTRQFQPSAEYLTLPFGQLKWADDGSPAANGAGKIIPTMEVLYTWHMVPSSINNVASQVSRIYNLVGKVNRYEFDSCPPGTLLLTGVESRPSRLIGGAYLNDIVFRMKYFSATNQLGITYQPARGHNYFLKFTPQKTQPGLPFIVTQKAAFEYELLTVDGTITGRGVYDSVDFAELFRP